MNQWQQIVELGKQAPYLPWGVGVYDRIMVVSPPDEMRRALHRQLTEGTGKPFTCRRIAVCAPSPYLQQPEAEQCAKYIVAACNAAPDMAARLMRLQEILLKRVSGLGLPHDETEEIRRLLTDSAALTTKEAK